MIPRLQAGSEVTVPSRRWGEKVSLLPVAAEMLLDEVGKIGSRSLTEEDATDSGGDAGGEVEGKLDEVGKSGSRSLTEEDSTDSGRDAGGEV